MSKIVRYRFMGRWWWFWVLCGSGSDAIVQLIASSHEPEAALDYLDWRLVSNRNQATPGLADRLAKTMVPAGLEKKRDYLVAVLRAQQYAH